LHFINNKLFIIKDKQEGAVIIFKYIISYMFVGNEG